MRKLPTHLKLLRGNPGKRPIMPDPEPPIPEKLPEPPEFLRTDARDEWWRIVPELKALGLLTRSISCRSLPIAMLMAGGSRRSK